MSFHPSNHGADSRLPETSPERANKSKESGETNTTVENGEYFEGGLQAWATVLGAWLIQFVGFGYTNAFGVYEDFYVREYLSQQSSSQISWIGSTQLFITLSSGILTGRLFDRGYFYHLIVTGTIIMIFSLFMLSLTKPHHYYQVFLSHGIGVGLGSGLMYIPSIAVVAHHFRRRRALAMGIVASGSSLGGILHPIMLNNLLHGPAGFTGGVRASAGLNLGLLVVAIALVRTRLPPQPPAKLLPAIRKFSRDSAYVAAVIATTIFVMGLFFPLFYLQLDAIEHGLDATFSFYTLSILNAASFVGRVVPGFFAHSFGVMNMVIACAASCTVLIFAMLGVKTVAGVSVFATLFGFFSGAYITLLGPMLAVLADDDSEIGARMGVSFTFTGIGSLVGTPITGALLTTHFVWWRPIVFSGITCLAGVGLFVVSRIIVSMRQRTPRS